MELLDDKMRVWLDSARFAKPSPGVYVLYNQSKEPIYIGETDNLEKTFTRYVEDGFEKNQCKQRTRFYQREVTENPQKRKQELIDTFKANMGRLPSCNSEVKIETQV